MSGYTQDKQGRLFDSVTGAFVGVVGPDGREHGVMGSEFDPVTRKFVLSAAATASLANSGIGPAVAGAYNWKASNTQQIALGMAYAQTGLGRFRNVFESDSFFTGTDSQGAGFANALRYGWISQSEELFRALGYNASEMFGMCGRGAASLAEVVSLDPRIAFGSAVTDAPNWFGISGYGWDLANSAANARVEFTPRDTFDIMETIALTGSSGVGSFTTENQAGTAGGTFNTLTGINGVQVVSHTVPAGSTKAVIRAAATRAIVYGVGTRDSTKLGIEMVNCGRSGGDLAYFLQASSGNGFAGPRNSIAALMVSGAAANCVHLGGGYNDMVVYSRSQATVETYTRQQCDVMKSLAAAPDLVWHIYGKLDNAFGNSAGFNNLLDAQVRIVIDEYDIPVIDHRKSFNGTAAEIKARGYLFSNGTHYAQLGQKVMSRNFVRCMAQTYA